jgi:hypothetical protein
MEEDFMNAWRRKARAGNVERHGERGSVLRTPFVLFPLTPALSLGERETLIRPVIPTLPYCPPPRSEEARCASSTKGEVELFPLLGERVRVRGKRAREGRVVRPITQCPGSERWMGEEFMNDWRRKVRAGNVERHGEGGAVLRIPFVLFPLTPALSLGERETLIRPVIVNPLYGPPPRGEETIDNGSR